MNILGFFRGVYVITVAKSAADEVLDLLVGHNIPFHGQKFSETTLTFRLYPPYFKTYAHLRGEHRYEGEVRKRLGLGALFHRHRKRVGFFIGAAMAVILLAVSSLFVWDVRISGNERISADEIRAALSARGVEIGTFIPTLDKERAEGEIMLDIGELSWISINLRGTVALVEVHERKETAEVLDTQSPSNLIAAMDGQITALEVTGGQTIVRHGQVVRKGDLLVSGIIDSKALGYRLVRARGEIFASVTLTYDVEIPYEMEKKVYTGEFFTEKSVIFFAKAIKLFGKDSISPSSCDTIEVERRIYLFDRIALPVFIRETTHSVYEMQTVLLSEEEAIALAYEKLHALCDETLEDAEVLARRTNFNFGEDVLTLHEEVDCVLNIAEEVKIDTKG